LKFQPSSKQRSRMSPLPEHPIRDRFAEFQCIALAKGTLHEQTKGDLLPQDQPQVKVLCCTTGRLAQVVWQACPTCGSCEQEWIHA